MLVLMSTMRWQQSARHYSRCQQHAWALPVAFYASAAAAETGVEFSSFHLLSRSRSLRYPQGSAECECLSCAKT